MTNKQMIDVSKCDVKMIRFLRLLIGGMLFAISFVITDKKDLADLVNMIKQELRKENNNDSNN